MTITRDKNEFTYEKFAFFPRKGRGQSHLAANHVNTRDLNLNARLNETKKKEVK